MPAKRPEAPRIRCAIYTRKSTDEGLEQEFNSLDAQREAGEAFIASQRGQGWTCLPDRYDDGGYSGGTMERPALKRLMADIAAGQVDCVVVYKVDRMSRSLLDFARIMGALEKGGVSFVSVTQQFNTTSSMGRLTLNILLSFAQFEREIISERTRDKIAANRRKGKWAGGPPILGYDVERAPSGARLLVNPKEAEQVRRIFELYVKLESTIAIVREIARRGWVNKLFINRHGETHGGKPFDRSTLHKMLTNPMYIGKISFKGTLYAGEHEGIIDEELFARVQAILSRNKRVGRGPGPHGPALLRGLVRCKSCGRAMSHVFTGRGNKRYRYYVCTRAQKNGWTAATRRACRPGNWRSSSSTRSRPSARTPTSSATPSRPPTARYRPRSMV
jgi:site-specific DNA recombinase